MATVRLVHSSTSNLFSVSQSPAQFSDSDLSDSEITLKLKNYVFNAGVSMRWRRQRRRKVQVQLRKQGKNHYSLISELEQLDDSAFSDDPDASASRWVTASTVRKKKSSYLTIDLKSRRITSPLPAQIDDSDLSDSGLLSSDLKSLLPKKKPTPTRPTTTSTTTTTTSTTTGPRSGPQAPRTNASLPSALANAFIPAVQYVRPHNINVPFSEILYNPNCAADVPPITTTLTTTPTPVTTTWEKPIWWSEDSVSEYELGMFKDHFNFAHEDGWRVYHSLRSDLVKLFLFKKALTATGTNELTFNEVRLNFDAEQDVAALFKLWKLLKSFFSSSGTTTLTTTATTTLTTTTLATTTLEDIVERPSKRRRIEIYRGKEILSEICNDPNISWSSIDPLKFLTMHVRDIVCPAPPPVVAAAVRPQRPLTAPPTVVAEEGWKRNGVVAEEQVRALFEVSARPDGVGSLGLEVDEAVEVVKEVLGGLTGGSVEEEGVTGVISRILELKKEEVNKKKEEIGEMMGKRMELLVKRLEIESKPEREQIAHKEKQIVNKVHEEFTGWEISNIRKIVF